jgi:hypothetical protein
MARTITVRRRYAVLGLLLLASGLYWLAVWAWIEATFAGVDPRSPLAVQATLHANAITLQATWAWVIGLVGVHAAAALIAGRRRDREALAGVGWSVVLHGLLLLTSGVIAPFS